MIDHYYSGNLFFRRTRCADPIGTLLYIHGLGESGLCFEHILNTLATGKESAHWKQLAPDLPGYGKSLPPERPISLSDCARQLFSWCQNDLTGPVIVIGHSMGGVIGQLIAEKSNVPVAAFINVEGNLSMGDCVFSGQAAGYSSQNFENFGFRQLQNTVFENAITFPAQRGYYASMRFAWPPQFHLNSCDLLDFSRPGDAAGRFAGLQIPRLYIAGQPRGICPDSMAALSRTSAPVTIIPDSGHWPFIDHPDSFLRAIKPLLEQKFETSSRIGYGAGDRSSAIASEKGL